MEEKLLVTIDDVKDYLSDCYGWTSDDFADYADFNQEDWIAEIKENFSLQQLYDYTGNK